MKALRSKLMMVICTVLVMSLIAACGGNNNDAKSSATQESTPSATETSTEPVKDAANPVEITWWNFPNYQALDGEIGKYENEIIKAFNEKHPEIKVNLEMITFDGGPEKLNVAIATNSAPDVIYDAPGRIIDWGKKKLLAPLNDMVSDEVKADVSEAFWKQSSVGDQIVMYPINTGPFLMAVNKTIFEQIGALDLLPLDKPDRTWTVAEFETALKAVKEKAPDIIPAGFFAKSQAGDQGTRAFIANLGVSRFLNEDNSAVAINSENGAKALDWIVQATKDKLIVSGAASLAAADVNDLFLNGKLAITLNYSAVLKAQNVPNKKVPFEEVLLPFPTLDGSEPKLEPFIGGMAIFNNDDADKIAASKKLVDFIANDEVWGNKNIIQTGGLSVRNSVTGLYGDDSEYKYSELARKFITDPPTVADGYAEVRTFWFPALQKALLGAATGQEALDEFAEKANKAIANAKTKLSR